MTIPFERTRAIIETKALLERLLVPRETPRIPRWLRGTAKALLRHYPGYSEIELAHKALPHLFGPVPPFSRFQASPQTQAVIDASTNQEEPKE